MTDTPELLSRRTFLASSAAAAAGAGLITVGGNAPVGAIATPAAAQRTTGWSDAARSGLYVGGVVFPYSGHESIADDLGLSASERSIIAKDFDALTLGMYMPWGPLKNESINPKIDWVPYDRMRRDPGLRSLWLHGHVLLYPSANETAAEKTKANPNPGFAWYPELSASGMRTLLSRYIKQVARRTRNDVQVWDVVNEVFGDVGENDLDSRGLRTRYVEYQNLGDNYVRLAFQWARSVNRNSVLVINDYGAEEENDKSDALFDFVVAERRRGTPIHGVGFQCHLSTLDGSNPPSDFNSIRRNFQRFADAGLKIYLTEIDVLSMREETANALPTSDELAAQAYVFRELAHIARENRAVHSYLLWDFVDHGSWLHPRSEPDPQDPDNADKRIDIYWFPTPFAGGASGGNAVAKPAYNSITEGLSGASTPSLPAVARLRSRWHPASSYLARRGPGGVPTQAVELAQLDEGSESWTSMRWTFHPAGDGYHRIRCQWNAGSGYLGRDGQQDAGGNWEPLETVHLGSHNSGEHQQWRIQSEPDGSISIVNRWGHSGALTRMGDPDGSGGWTPNAAVGLLAYRAYSSQRWEASAT